MVDYTDIPVHRKELIFIRVNACSDTDKTEIFRLGQVYGYRIADYGKDAVLLEGVQTEEKNDIFIHRWKCFFVTGWKSPGAAVLRSRRWELQKGAYPDTMPLFTDILLHCKNSISSGVFTLERIRSGKSVSARESSTPRRFRNTRIIRPFILHQRFVDGRRRLFPVDAAERVKAAGAVADGDGVCLRVEACLTGQPGCELSGDKRQSQAQTTGRRFYRSDSAVERPPRGP